MVWPPAGRVPVQLACSKCHGRFATQVWNSQWNSLTCEACRTRSNQYIRISAATVEPFSGRVGGVTVRPGGFDWSGLGDWAAFLGPREERRVPLCFQLEQHGLPGRSFRFRFTARRTDAQRIVAERETTWQSPRFPNPTGPELPLIWWLPPTDIWDQDRLACDVEVAFPDGEVVYQGRVEQDIRPLQPAAEPEAEQPAEPSADQSEADVIDRFHHLYYYGSPGEPQVWLRTSWLGVPCLQCPLDLWVYQEILTEIRPDLVVETGTLFGGNALFLAHVMDQLGHGRVVSIDSFALPRPTHPRVRYLKSSSTDSAVVQSVFEERPGEKCLVILDSDHSRDHVLAEMRLFAPHVTTGSYLIVTDSNINGHPVYPAFGPGPYEAVADFLQENSEFQVDHAREKFKLTFNPKGFLKRIQSPVHHPGM
jgi:cephalosporin hydroxylase